MARNRGTAAPKVGDANEAASPGSTHKYGTRAAKHGIDPAIRSRYDMKYHVMDEVLRPKHVARRRGRVRTDLVSKIEGDAGEAEEESPSEASDAAVESESESESDEESATDDEVLVNEPDPRASRRSERTAGKRRPEYRTRHHPQDSNIPGFQHLARRRPKRLTASVESDKPVQKKRKVEKPAESPVLRSRSPSVSSDTVDDLVDETLHIISQIPPSQRVQTAQEAVEGAVQQEPGAMVDEFVDETLDIISQTPPSAQRLHVLKEGRQGEISQGSGAASSTTLPGESSGKLATLDDYLPPDPSTPVEQDEDYIEAYGESLNDNIVPDQHTASDTSTTLEA